MNCRLEHLSFFFPHRILPIPASTSPAPNNTLVVMIPSLPASLPSSFPLTSSPPAQNVINFTSANLSCQVHNLLSNYTLLLLLGLQPLQTSSLCMSYGVSLRLLPGSFLRLAFLHSSTSNTVFCSHSPSARSGLCYRLARGDTYYLVLGCTET